MGGERSVISSAPVALSSASALLRYRLPPCRSTMAAAGADVSGVLTPSSRSVGREEPLGDDAEEVAASDDAEHLSRIDHGDDQHAVVKERLRDLGV